MNIPNLSIPDTKSNLYIPSPFFIILAGGMGKRMGGELPKVLHKVKGEAMVVRLIKQALKLEPKKILVVIGKYYLMIKSEIEKEIKDDRIAYVIQEQPLGTGHAVKCTLDELGNNDNIIIINGDVPMISYDTIKCIYNRYLEENVELLITSIELDRPSGSGRIIKEDGYFKEIIEEKDCTDEQKKIKQVNCGIYVCQSEVLKKCVPKIECNNVQKEYYLTDLVKLYNGRIGLHLLNKEKEIEIYNINTREQLDFINKFA